MKTIFNKTGIIVMCETPVEVLALKHLESLEGGLGSHVVFTSSLDESKASPSEIHCIGAQK